MADIFVSYAREDRDVVRALAARLEGRGWSVWWDRHILAGKDFDNVLQEELDRASCVLVAWSSHSVASRWVKAEAGEGLRREVLIPVCLDAAMPPLGFRNIQTVSFDQSSIRSDSPPFQELLEALTALLGVPQSAPRPAATPLDPPAKPADGPLEMPRESPPDNVTKPPGTRIGTRSRVLMGLIAILLFALAAYSFIGGRHRMPDDNQGSGPAAGTPPSTSSIANPQRTTPPSTEPLATRPAAPLASVQDPTRPAVASDTATDAAIQRFIERFVDAASAGDSDRMLGFYADRVDYFSMGTVGPDTIREDKTAYFRRWPIVKLRLDGDVSIQNGPVPATRLVTFNCAYEVTSPARHAHATGLTTTTLSIAVVEGTLKIVSQTEKVKSGKAEL